MWPYLFNESAVDHQPNNHPVLPQPPPAVPQHTCIPLDRAVNDITYLVDRLSGRDSHHNWTERLEELGFLPGEAVTVLARGQPGGDPLSIRVGHSTFALRRAEAACVQVRPATRESQP